MAISYQSQVVESNPYVLPFDLNLLSQVNKYKQTNFYQNADKLNHALNDAISLDIVKGDEKEYATKKVNGLVSQLNNAGGLDLSDFGVTNQIEGAITNVYSDNYVANAIADTKQIRQLQSNITKLKEDPKLSKYYSAANEWDATQPLQKYMNSKFGQRYSDFGGTTAPTPYKGNVYQRLKESLKTLKPNITVEYKDGVPYYFDKSENAYVEADKVYADISANLDGDILNQIGIDSRYSMRNYSPEQTLKAYNDAHNTKLNSLNKQLEAYNQSYNSEPSTTKKGQIGSYIDELKGRIKGLQDNYSDMNPSKLSQTEEGLNALKQRVYTDDLLDKAVTANTYKQSKSQLVADQAQMYDLWQKKEEVKYQYANKLLQTRASLQGNKTKTNKADEPIFNEALGTWATNTETDEDLEKTKDEHTISGLNTTNEELEKKNNSRLISFIQDFAGDNDYKELDINSANNTSPVLEKLFALDGRGSGLSVDDLRLGLNALDKNKKPLLTETQKSFVSKVVKTIDDVATGKVNSSTFSDLKVSKTDFISMLDEIQDNDMLIANNKKAISDATDKALKEVYSKEKFTQAEINIYNDYVKNPGNYTTRDLTTFGKGNTLKSDISKTLRSAIQKIYSSGNNVKVFKNIDEDLGKNYRRNYMSATFNDPKSQTGLQAMIAKLNPESGKVDDIRPIGIHQKANSTDWEVEYSYDAGKGEYEPGTPVTITNDQVRGLGLSANTRPDLEAAFLYQKETPAKYRWSKALGNEGVFKYTIRKSGNDPNRNEFTVKFYNGDNAIPIKRNFNGEPIQSYESAKNFVKQILSDDYISVWKSQYPKATEAEIKQLILQSLSTNYTN